ncbi:MAG TPA: TolC family protein, partial [Burkholderiales bacterium]|nr:TolC family protein [Burkholderiales bacterium]
MNGRSAVATLALALLGGCAVTPPYVEPTPAAPEQWSVPLPGAGNAGEVDLSQWWNQFADPMLATLVERALKDNRDVRIATARIAEARALQRQADARVLPAVNASGSAARDRASENNRFPLRGIPNPVDLYQTGFDASWEMDLFGGLQSARSAAAADTQHVIFDREALAVSMSAEVALSYLHLRGAQARITSLDQQIDVARDTMQLVESRVKAGLVSELDRVRAHETLASLEARRPPLQAIADVETRRLG